MHPLTYREFERICRARGAAGQVLEVGAVPATDTLLCMTALSGAKRKVGINLTGPHTFRDFTIMRGSTHDMRVFADAEFDLVLCNAVFEHDPFFWKSIEEIRRVTRSGGLIVIGAPGFTGAPANWSEKPRGWFEGAALRIPFLRPFSRLLQSTPTIGIHDAPGDYYRFSPQAFRDVFLAGMNDVEIRTILFPPVIVGAGIKP